MFDDSKIFIFRSILKNVNIGLSAQTVEDDLVEEIMAQGGSVSPIVTIEPRRRKFHKAIKVSIPLPPKCLAKKKHGKGAQLNGGDDESVTVTQLSPALKRAGYKGDQMQKKPKGQYFIFWTTVTLNYLYFNLSSLGF